MRNWAIVFAILLSSSLSTWARKEESVEELKSRAGTASIDEQASIYVRIAELQLDAADKFFNDGKAEQAQAAVQDVVNYSEKAGNAATKSSRKLKPTEIAVRKMAHKLRDIKRAVSFEDQVPLQTAVDRLEKIRTDLLAVMFGKGEK